MQVTNIALRQTNYSTFSAEVWMEKVKAKTAYVSVSTKEANKYKHVKKKEEARTESVRIFPLHQSLHCR